MRTLNYKHLHYFWVVAKTGGIGLASERLHLTPQTISGQISLLEETLGYKLFNRIGRHLELNDAGHMVLSYADRMFTLGEELEAVLRFQPGSQPLQFRVGIADAVPKTIAYLLLEPALKVTDPPHIICREGKLDILLAELAIHRLDIVISDTALPTNINIRGYSHMLGESGTSFFATPALAKKYKTNFPHSLNDAPFLMPGEDAAVRPRLQHWFNKQNVHPRITGEFDDGALLYAFGEAGIGIFSAPSAVTLQVKKQYGVVQIGESTSVTEHFYAISVERKLTHPAVLAIQSAARKNLGLIIPTAS